MYCLCVAFQFHLLLVTHRICFEIGTSKCYIEYRSVCVCVGVRLYESVRVRVRVECKQNRLCFTRLVVCHQCVVKYCFVYVRHMCWYNDTF